MWLMHVRYDGRPGDREISVVDGAGVIRFESGSVGTALFWLSSRGRRTIGIPVGDEVEVYRIEPRDFLQPGPAEYTLRLDPAGREPDPAAPDPLDLPLTPAVRNSQASTHAAKIGHGYYSKAERKRAKKRANARAR